MLLLCYASLCACSMSMSFGRLLDKVSRTRQAMKADEELGGPNRDMLFGDAGDGDGDEEEEHPDFNDTTAAEFKAYRARFKNNAELCNELYSDRYFSTIKTHSLKCLRKS